jgi:dihydroxyacetone kinase
MSQQLPDLTINSLFGQEGKVVLVTGGGTGLGLMMATGFAQNGAKGEQSSGPSEMPR